MDDPLDSPWCCLVCYSKFILCQCVAKRGSPYIHCPKCGSANLHPIAGEAHDAQEYAGPIGTLN